MKQFIYKNIFMYSSLQFCGHIEEYFAHHTKKLIVYIVMPRLKNKFNLLRVYKNGKMVEEKRVWSSENVVLYYLSWYVHYLYFIFTCFSAKEHFFVISNHPISFIGMTFQRLFRKITYVYWIGDYFPPVNKYLYWFEKLKTFYHERVSFRYYLSDGINKKINGRIRKDATHRTIMWGVKQKAIRRNAPKHQVNLLFVGLIKQGQGLEKLFAFLRTHKEYSLKIIGICGDALFSEYQTSIANNGIQKQVFFPNMFYSDDQLTQLTKSCHIGIALYDISPLSSAYYTDPGKVKSYTEVNLPVIMSNISSIASYIQKYHAGEVIDQKSESLIDAIEQIRKDYLKYMRGVELFNKHFFFDSYYNKSFVALAST